MYSLFEQNVFLALMDINYKVGYWLWVALQVWSH